MRQRGVLVAMVMLVGLVVAACSSGSSSGDSSAATAELAGVWSTEDGAATFEFLDNGETALFTTEHFEECTNTYEADGDQVVVDIECGSLDGAGQSSLGGGAPGVVTVGAHPPDFYSAEWTLGTAPGQSGLGEEGMSGAPAVGESAAGVPGLIFGDAVIIITIAEDPSSTVTYQTQEGLTLHGPCADNPEICEM